MTQHDGGTVETNASLLEVIGQRIGHVCSAAGHCVVVDLEDGVPLLLDGGEPSVCVENAVGQFPFESNLVTQASAGVAPNR